MIHVKDDLINRWFNFAIIINIKDNKPNTNCNLYESSLPALCSKAECKIKLKVVNDTGENVEGADVFFYDCYVGSTDKDGMVEGYVPCIVSVLSVEKSDYKAYAELTNYYKVNNSVITLHRLRNVTFNFHVIPLIAHKEGYDPDATPGVFNGYYIVNISKVCYPGSGCYTYYIISCDRDKVIIRPSELTHEMFAGESGNKKVLDANIDFTVIDDNIFSGEDMGFYLSTTKNGKVIDSDSLYGPSYNTYLVQIKVKNNITERIIGILNLTERIEGEEIIDIYIPAVLGFIDYSGCDNLKEGDTFLAQRLEENIALGESEKIYDAIKRCGLKVIEKQ